jgi:dipeptidyl-peptidase-4
MAEMNMRKRAWFFCVILLMAVTFPVCSGTASNQEQNDPLLLTLDRIFLEREFSTEGPGDIQWLEDGYGYMTLEPSLSVEGGSDIVKHDPATGQKEILVSADRLIPEGSSQPLDVEDYSFSQDRDSVLIFTNTERVWRENTRGDYWVLGLTSGKLRKLGGDAGPSLLMFAKFSPGGDRVAYVMKNDIYVESLDTGRILPLTGDGSETIINGTSDWTYEEEFRIRDGFRWSPDGQHIAFWNFDSGEVGEFRMINNTDTLYPEIVTFRHAKVGTVNSACRIGVVKTDGGDPVWFDPSGGKSRDYYIARMEWAGKDEIVFQWLNRLQKRNHVILGSIHSGKMRTVMTERDEAWVDVQDFTWIENGAALLWLSERDGWQHLYRIDRATGEASLLTPGDFDVLGIEAVDEKTGWVYFTASPDNPTQRFLYRAKLAGEVQVERVTPEGIGGSHSYQISSDARWAIHKWSSLGNPPRIEIVELPSHKSLRLMASNDELRNKLERLNRGESEFFRVNIGDVELDGWMMKPPDFDPGKKYPLLFHIYGEPPDSTVIDRWGGRDYLWHLMLTQKGYIVASLDNRGTDVPRGRAWRKSIYRQVGILACKDQAAALRQMLKERPYIDPERIGIWGWSGGGQMSLNMIFRYPELYSTAMAIAFVSDQRLYDTIYQERYMGLPEDNEEGYSEGSPITHAHRLEGNLLIVHGTADDNVHYQNFERLVNELVAHNKHFTMMSYPNRAHGISEGTNTTRHLFGMLTMYVLANL